MGKKGKISRFSPLLRKIAERMIMESLGSASRRYRRRAPKPFFDLFQGIGIGKTKEAFPARPEIDSRGHPHLGFMENIKGQAIGISLELPGVGQDIKSAGGFHRQPEADFFQPSDHKLSADIIGLPHSGHICLGLGQSGDPGPLSHGVGRDKKVLMDLLERSHEGLGGNQVTQSPAGHGVELGKPVEYEGPVGKLQDRMLLPFVDQTVIDFIGDPVPCRRFPPSVPAQQLPGGIGR